MSQRRGWVGAACLLLVAACAAPIPQVPVTGNPTATSASPTGSTVPVQTEPNRTETAVPTPLPTAALPPANPIAACDLLSASEASAALGVTIDSAAPSDGITLNGVGWYSTCQFDRLVFDTLTPLYFAVGSGAQYTAQFEELRQGADVTPLAGIGDEAFVRIGPFWGVGAPVGALFARSGNIVFDLVLGIVDMSDAGELVVAGDTVQQQEILTQLAGMVVGRLASAPAPQLPTCQLLTAPEAAAIVGLPLISAFAVPNDARWGEGCSYIADDGVMELFVGVNNRATAAATFADCATASEPVSGIGDQAYFNTSCDIAVGPRHPPVALLVRIGTSLLIVAEGGKLEAAAARTALLEVAAVVLGRLPGAPAPSASAPVPTVQPTPTSAPTAGPSGSPDLSAGFAQPCSLITDDEVWTAVGAPITSHQEYGAGPEDAEARCLYRNDDVSTQPLDLTLDRGENYIAQFENWRSGGLFTPVDGIGDAAISDQYEGIADQPLVNLYVRVGQVIVTLRLGGIDRSADGTEVAPADPEGQLVILLEIAQTVIDRLLYPPPG